MTGSFPKKAMSTFDWQITTLFEVLGAYLTSDQMKNAYLAQILKIEPSGVTQRRNGKTALQIGEAAKIINGYGLNVYGLNHQLFDISDQDQFLDKLKERGVGVYETNPRRRLAQVLEAAIVQNSLSVEIRESRGNRGISYTSDNRGIPQLFHVGQRVEIIVRGEEGRHMAIVQRILDMDYVMDTLAPTAILPETFMSGPTLVLPGDGNVGLTVREPKGRYKLMAVEGEERLISLFSGGDLSRLEQGETCRDCGEPVHITDEIARAILRHIELSSAKIRCAVLDYIVA